MAVQLGGTGLTNVGATAYLSADTALNNTGTMIAGTGATTGSLPPGTYRLSAKAVCSDSAGAAVFTAEIYDGAAAVDTGQSNSQGAGAQTTIMLGRVITTTVATTFTLRAKDSTATTGTLLRSNALATTANLASSITYERLS